MGRNKDLRIKISGLKANIDLHEQKIRQEQRKPHPNEARIRHWQHEIKANLGRVANLERRLSRHRVKTERI
jgi:hypothetical protein